MSTEAKRRKTFTTQTEIDIVSSTDHGQPKGRSSFQVFETVRFQKVLPQPKNVPQFLKHRRTRQLCQASTVQTAKCSDLPPFLAEREIEKTVQRAQKRSWPVTITRRQTMASRRRQGPLVSQTGQRVPPFLAKNEK